jgi:hypothetical protein
MKSLSHRVRAVGATVSNLEELLRQRFSFCTFTGKAIDAKGTRKAPEDRAK